MGGGDAEEGSERGVPGAAPVEAEDEFVEIGLKVFAAQAVVDAQGPDLEVGEDAMDQGRMTGAAIAPTRWGSWMRPTAPG